MSTGGKGVGVLLSVEQSRVHSRPPRANEFERKSSYGLPNNPQIGEPVPESSSRLGALFASMAPPGVPGARACEVSAYGVTRRGREERGPLLLTSGARRPQCGS